MRVTYNGIEFTGPIEVVKASIDKYLRSFDVKIKWRPCDCKITIAAESRMFKETDSIQDEIESMIKTVIKRVQYTENDMTITFLDGRYFICIDGIAKTTKDEPFTLREINEFYTNEINE